MKKKYSKIISSIAIAGVFLFLAFGSGESNKTENPDSNNPIRSTTTEVSDNTNQCSVCGRTFSGKGYQEVTEGVWKPCEDPYQCQICSAACGMKHTGNWDEINERTNTSSNNSPQKCLNCGQGFYSSKGICTVCDAVTPEREKMQKDRLPNCEACSGSGKIDYGMGDVRVCSSCNGQGKQTY